MKKILVIMVSLAILGLLLAGCSEIARITTPGTTQEGVATLSRHVEEAPYKADLLAGQTEDIGDVLIWNDKDALYVKFVYEGPDCGFLEVHLQVDEGEFSPDILTEKGNPIPGQFEKSYYNEECFKEYTFTYNLDDEGFDCDNELKIAAHAAMCVCEEDVSGETAWGCGDGNCNEFDGKNWATYFSYTVQCPKNILVVSQKNPSCTVQNCPDNEEQKTVKGYLDNLGYSYNDKWEEEGTPLKLADFADYDAVIYLSWSYPVGWANLDTVETLIGYFNNGGNLIVVSDDISRVGNGRVPPHPYQPQDSTYGDDWEAITRLEYFNNGGSKEMGIYDGYQITLGTGTHDVLSGIGGVEFDYYNDCDTTNFLDGPGATVLATSERNSLTTETEELKGGTAITAFDNGSGGKIVAIGVNFYGGYYKPVNGPAIPVDIAEKLLDNAIKWVIE